MTIETKQLNISEELKRKIEFICKFANVNYTLKKLLSIYESGFIF